MLFLVFWLFKTLGNSFLGLYGLFEEALCFLIKTGYVTESYYFPVRSAVRTRHVIGSYYFLAKSCVIMGHVMVAKLKLLFSHQEPCQDGTCNGANVGLTIFSSEGVLRRDV